MTIVVLIEMVQHKFGNHGGVDDILGRLDGVFPQLLSEKVWTTIKYSYSYSYSYSYHRSGLATNRR